VLGYAIRRTNGDRAGAEDAVSETFLIAWRRLEEIPPDPLPWLLVTARKVLANQRRTAQRRSPDGPTVPLEAVADPAQGASVADRVADRQAFAEAFAALSPGDRETLALVSWDGLAPREAAIVVGCSAATFSLRLFRARRRLMKELAARGHSYGDRAGGSPAEPPADPKKAR
jgi:RNA polymerase sigma factor (sigma-70 family)